MDRARRGQHPAKNPFHMFSAHSAPDAARRRTTDSQGLGGARTGPKRRPDRDVIYISTIRYRPGGNLVKAYCVKCKKSVEMKDPKKVKLKNGKPATKGSCPKCGTKVFRIGG